ncbi:family 8 glycosyl transferase [Colletotrichum cereale]|nr:family 8 glycosyl transferase [Colletotrichum cereale]
MGSIQPSTEDVAYCTLVTNDGYVVAAAVLAESLKATGTKIPRCVIITAETMSEESIATLRGLFDHVIPVPAMAALTTTNLDLIGRPDLHATMTKLRLWSLSQFRRVLYLDADTLVLSNLDHVFDLPESVTFAASPEIGFPDCFNSGVMLLRPDAATYAELTAFATRVDSFDGGDQGLLNVFFGDGTKNHPATVLIRQQQQQKQRGGKGAAEGSTVERNWFRLSFTYNMEMHRVYRFYIPAALRYKDQHKILHFIGKDKPWHYEDGKVDTPDGAGAYDHFYADMVGKWWETRRSIAAPL